MSSTSRRIPSTQGIDPAIVALREELQEDLLHFLDHDVHIAGYVVAWLSRNIDLADLEALVDELNDAYRLRDGSRVLDHPRHQ